MQVVVKKPELEEFINEQVNGGRFSTPADVVEAALERLRDGEDELDDATHQQLLRANDQIERGEGQTVEQAREFFRRKASGR